MAGEAAQIAGRAVDGPPLSQRDRWRVFFYLSAVLLLLGFGAPNSGTIEIPITFFLKNKLQLEASEVASFRFWTALPVFFSFVFGFIRDRWSPFGLGDRGYLILFGVITTLLYVGAAAIDVSYVSLLWGFVIVTISYLFIFSAWKGLLSTIAQQHVMSGQLSFVWNIVGGAIGLISLVIGGLLSEWLERADGNQGAAILFLVGAGFMALVAALGLWRAPGVFSNVRPEPHSATPLGDMARLFKHWPVYPALLIWLLWNFAPGTGTVLQYHLADVQHASDFQWGVFNALFLGSMMPTLLLFGFLCQRLSLRTLLWAGAIVGAPQMVPLLFIDSIDAALVAAIPMGLMGGIARGAFLALIIRACPHGLQGTMMTLAGSTALLSSRVGNMWGSAVFDHYGGFPIVVAATVAVYTLILPALLLVPRSLIDSPDARAQT